MSRAVFPVRSIHTNLIRGRLSTPSSTWGNRSLNISTGDSYECFAFIIPVSIPPDVIEVKLVNTSLA